MLVSCYGSVIGFWIRMTLKWQNDYTWWASTSQLVVCWAYCPVVSQGLHPPQSHLVEGIFAWMWHWFLSRVPDQNGASQAWYIVEIHHSGWKPSLFYSVQLSDESISEVRLVHACTPSHGLKRFWQLRSRWVNTSNKDSPTQHAASMNTECDYLYGWTEKWSRAKISLKTVNPRDQARNTKDEEENT